MTRALLTVALLAPLSGCILPFVHPCGGAECPQPEPVERGAFLVVDGDPDVLVGGSLDIGEDDVILSWTDGDGNQFEAVYAVVGETP